LMHRELVDRHRWLTEAEFLRALSFCMMLPGPEAMQLATYCGWRLRGTSGGLIAGLLFVLPGAVVVLALAAVYAAFGRLPLVAAMFTGVQAAVLVIVLHALHRVAKRALRGWQHWAIAAVAFLALFAFNLPFPVVVLGAGLAGFVFGHSAAPILTPASQTGPHTGMMRAALAQTLIWGAIWLVPLAALWLLENGLLFEIGVFFSQLAVVTFGGAYAVLAWMAQAVVQEKAWLTLPQMIDALGMAETTPGPLILVTEFVAYLAGHRAGGWLMGTAAATVALWMTFAPCFLWIFAGAPFIRRLEHAPRLSAALGAITAAVVGVIANLSLWFAAHVLFGEVATLNAGPIRTLAPVWSTLSPTALFLAVLAGGLILWRHWGLPATLLICAILSVLLTML
ncbi:MAG: chromate efflux transporter, partial [Paracoccaceae bacterium]|nr:chromate efflux transporter [Paracoccaceae bacterium]